MGWTEQRSEEIKSEDLELFCSLAQARNLTRVARDAGLTTAAVSRRLKALETELNTQLVVRSTRQFALTEEGRKFLTGSREILEQMNALRESVGNGAGPNEGWLRINASFGFGRCCVAPAVGRFAKEYPKVRVRLGLTEKPADLVSERYDLGIYVAELPDSTWHTKRLFANDRVLCAAPSYLKRLEKELKSPQDLSELDTIDIVEDEGTFGIWTLSKGVQTISVPIRPRFCTNDGESGAALALAGLGIVLRSRWAIAEHLRVGKLRQVLSAWRQPADARICWAGKRLSARARLFVDFLAKDSAVTALCGKE